MLTGTEIKLAVSFGLGIVVFLTLTVFRPFGLHTIENVTYLSGFGLMVTISLLFHLFLGPLVLASFFDEERWTIKHQLILIASITVLITLLNYIYNRIIGEDISPQYSLLSFFFMTSAVAIFPIFIMLYITEAVARHRNINAAKHISLPKPKELKSKLITIKSDSISEGIFELELEAFIYAVAANNYTEIHYIAEGKTKQKLIRAKLKSVENQLGKNHQILRCHKSYLINKDRIISTQGNARSMTVTLNGSDFEIPISRSFDRSLL